jgi:hypothetical protein
MRLLKIQLQNCQVNPACKEQHPALTRHKTLPLLTTHTNNTHSENDVSVNCQEEPPFLCLNANGFTYLTTRNISGLIYVTMSYQTCTKQRIKSEGECAKRLAPFRALSIFLKGPVYFEECENSVANRSSLFQNLPEGCDAKKRTMN